MIRKLVETTSMATFRKIVLAFDSFKGSLSSFEAAKAAAKAINSEMPEVECDILMIADGGEGTVEAVVSGRGGQCVQVTVQGPLGIPVEASYGICGKNGDLAVIESAAACGLTLIAPQDRNPWYTSSFGVGQLIMDAIDKGCRRFLIGLGGSATNDGGTGMLKALGFRFLDNSGHEIGIGGGEVGRITTIDSSGVKPEIFDSSFTIACDVTNPLTGPEGASHVFGPQKGANPDMVNDLDKGLEAFAHVASSFLGKDFSSRPGTGAAGGLGFAFIAFLGAELRSGIEMVLDAIDFDSHVEDSSLVLTGEGKLDHQTCMGKAPMGVLCRAKAHGVPVIALGGAVDPGASEALEEAGFAALFPIIHGPCAIETALNTITASYNMERTVRQIIRMARLSLF